MARLRRFIPILVLVAGLIVVFALGLDEYVSVAALKEHHTALSAFVSEHHALAALTYGLVYAGVTALSVPGGALLTLTGGFPVRAGIRHRLCRDRRNHRRNPALPRRPQRFR